jgi:hypothetical protein
MGVWAAGLYSSDFALDLRSAVRAVARLPFDGDRLTEILCETEPAAASDPENEDHTTFWLIVADQFARRSIVCDRVRDTAIAIIDSGSDLAFLGKLGMSASNLTKRSQILNDVRGRVASTSRRNVPRAVLKNPQPLLMGAGDVIIYPTSGGRPINPYLGTRERNKNWRHDGWAAFVVIDRGRAFDFLAWYRPLTLSAALDGKPSLEGLRGDVSWRLQPAGTCSRIHFRRMELETIGALPVDGSKVAQFFPGLRPGTSQAINDISIANSMRATAPSSFAKGRPETTTIPRIDHILTF